jgi:hypothetical protein
MRKSVNNKKSFSMDNFFVILITIIVYIVAGIYFGFNEQFNSLNDFCIIPNVTNCYYINVSNNPFFLIVPLLKIILVIYMIGRSKNLFVKVFAIYLFFSISILTLLGYLFPYDPVNNFLIWVVIDLLKILEIIHGIFLIVVYIGIKFKDK